MSECKILGIELGSSRIKAVLINEKGDVLASGAHDWENMLVDGYWTYSLDKVWNGIQDAFSKVAKQYNVTTGQELRTVDAMGVSAMMHGYLPFGSDGNLLAAFRTWRNTNTVKAAEILTEKLQFNIPDRWSISHLYQCVLDKEEHVKNIDFLTTLSGYVHWQLTGEKVLGIGDASGMFPIDSTINNFDKSLLATSNKLLSEKGFTKPIESIFPTVLVAGEKAGILTEQGAKLLDPTGMFNAGIPLCPPEGDAGTGMVATNSVAQRTGNVSAGTSIFAMIVLEKALKKLHREIDMVTTPCSSPVAMVHCNTCTSELDAWVKMFYEIAQCSNSSITKGELYDLFYQKALEGDSDCDSIISYNYFAGEPITKVDKGVPLLVRRPDTKMTFANFARSQIYGTMATLKLGMDILSNEEDVALDSLLGHGGLFKTPKVGQKIMADALNIPIAVMETASEGGPWGIALLASFMLNKEESETLQEYLKLKIFAGSNGSTISPTLEDVKGFEAYLENYKKWIEAEDVAGKAL